LRSRLLLFRPQLLLKLKKQLLSLVAHSNVGGARSTKEEGPGEVAPTPLRVSEDLIEDSPTSVLVVELTMAVAGSEGAPSPRRTWPSPLLLAEFLLLALDPLRISTLPACSTMVYSPMPVLNLLVIVMLLRLQISNLVIATCLNILILTPTSSLILILSVVITVSMVAGARARTVLVLPSRNTSTR